MSGSASIQRLGLALILVGGIHSIEYTVMYERTYSGGIDLILVGLVLVVGGALIEFLHYLSGQEESKN